MSDDLREAAALVRRARALVEEAQRLTGSLPFAQAQLETAREILGTLGGDDPENAFASPAKDPDVQLPTTIETLEGR